MFRKILASHWGLLGPSVQKHYGLKNGESITLQGLLDVRQGTSIKFLMPLIRLTGALVPVAGNGFAVTVENWKDEDIFYWRRRFEKDNRVYEFNSSMQQFGNDIVEFVGLGIGIRMTITVQDNRLVYIDKGYVFKPGPFLVPVPVGMLVGRSDIMEFDSDSKVHDIDMTFIVNHPFFGFAFSYMGYFDIAEIKE